MIELKPPYRKSARAIRAARKMLQLSQAKVAKMIGVSQAKFSRFESGTMIPSALEWLSFCEITKISTKSILSGNFELGALEPIQLRSGTLEGGFKLPEKYSKDRGSRPLSLKLITDFTENCFGEKTADELYAKLGVDPDFFACLKNQISAQFGFDLISKLISTNALNKETLPIFFEPISRPQNHGQCWSFFQDITNKKELIMQRVQVTGLYEANFAAKVLDEKKTSLDIFIGYRDHVLACDIPPESLDFFNNLYFSNYLKTFGSSPDRLKQPTVKLIEARKNSNLVYRISFQ